MSGRFDCGSGEDAGGMTPRSAAQEAAKERGSTHQLYVAKCAACHSVDGSGTGTIGRSMGIASLTSPQVQGRSDEAAEQILNDAKALEEAGAFAVVLEGIPSTLGERVTKALAIPTIGIGAGPHCDAQVLVIQDVLGLTPDHVAKFVRQYAKLGDAIEAAARQFDQDVRDGAFPTPEHEYSAR